MAPCGLERPGRGQPPWALGVVAPLRGWALASTCIVRAGEYRLWNPRRRAGLPASPLLLNMAVGKPHAAVTLLPWSFPPKAK